MLQKGKPADTGEVRDNGAEQPVKPKRGRKPKKAETGDAESTAAEVGKAADEMPEGTEAAETVSKERAVLKKSRRGRPRKVDMEAEQKAEEAAAEAAPETEVQKTEQKTEPETESKRHRRNAAPAEQAAAEPAVPVGPESPDGGRAAEESKTEEKPAFTAQPRREWNGQERPYNGLEK